MKKVILALGVLLALTFQSCMKEYDCVCTGYLGGVKIGTMKAMTKTEANRGCRAMGGSDLCTAK